MSESFFEKLRTVIYLGQDDLIAFGGRTLERGRLELFSLEEWERADWGYWVAWTYLQAPGFFTLSILKEAMDAPIGGEILMHLRDGECCGGACVAEEVA